MERQNQVRKTERNKNIKDNRMKENKAGRSSNKRKD
jgi:hypothetical protein